MKVPLMRDAFPVVPAVAGESRIAVITAGSLLFRAAAGPGSTGIAVASSSSGADDAAAGSDEDRSAE
jgi:hypothetical protein